eukprot:76339-Pleurochrysis_carterae.AAC.6
MDPVMGSTTCADSVKMFLQIGKFIFITWRAYGILDKVSDFTVQLSDSDAFNSLVLLNVLWKTLNDNKEEYRREGTTLSRSLLNSEFVFWDTSCHRIADISIGNNSHKNVICVRQLRRYLNEHPSNDCSKSRKTNKQPFFVFIVRMCSYHLNEYSCLRYESMRHKTYLVTGYKVCGRGLAYISL